MKAVAGRTAVRSGRAEAGLWPRRALTLVTVLAISTVIGYFAYDRFFKPQPITTAAPQLVAVSRGSVVATVSATGSVVPAATADLSFSASGRLKELNVTIGQAVQKGDVLARLETSDLELQVVQAKAQLASAEAKLKSLQAGSTQADIAQARAQLLVAQAKLATTEAGPTAAALQSAQASVASAGSQLAKAQSDLDNLKAGPTQDSITGAQITLERAKISLHTAQAAYDKISWRPDAAATTEAMNLWQATTDYQAAELTYKTQVAGPTTTDIAIAAASVTSAKAQLATAEASLATLAAGPTADELATAEAAVSQAEKQLDLVLNPATESDLLVAQASVEQARAASQSAQNTLDDATMLAPFAGVVAAANGTVGATVSGVVVSLLDVSSPRLQIALPETDVAKVEVGQQATLTFEALSGQQVTGKVLYITPKATVQSGVATYPAVIAIDTLTNRAQNGATQEGTGSSGQQRQGTAGSADQAQGTRAGASGSQRAAAQSQVDLSKVKPGMTASVSIEYLRKDNVLVVPNRAVRAQGRDRVVDVVVGDKIESRVVTIGAADQQFTEITAGLAEGDQVVVTGTTTSTAASRVPGLQGGAPGGAFPGGGFPGGR